MSRIDGWMPDARFRELHRVRVAAPPEVAYAAVRRLEMHGSWLIRILFALRSLPAALAGRGRGTRAGLGLSMESLLRAGFVLLDEDAPREIVLGLVGRFWTPTGGLITINPSRFRAFGEPGMAVAAWNFTVDPAPFGCVVTTETRVRCTDDAARRSFARYWRVVRPFSGLIRMDMLRAIRRDAERAVREGGAEGVATG